LLPLVAAAGDDLPEDHRIYVPGHMGPEGYDPGSFGQRGIPRYPEAGPAPQLGDSLGPSREETAESALWALAGQLRTDLRGLFLHRDSPGNPLRRIAEHSDADDRLWAISYSASSMVGFLRLTNPRPRTAEELVTYVTATLRMRTTVAHPVFSGAHGPGTDPAAVIHSWGFARSLQRFNEGPPPAPPAGFISGD
jgi:hypothetical protein